MIEFICLFFPAFISIANLNKKAKLEEKVIKYFIYNIFINIVVLCFVAFSNGFKILYLGRDIFTVVFSIKYLVMASVTAFVLPYLVQFFRKNFKLKIRKDK